jgi:hypothetical protein
MRLSSAPKTASSLHYFYSIPYYSPLVNITEKVNWRKTLLLLLNCWLYETLLLVFDCLCVDYFCTTKSTSSLPMLSVLMYGVLLYASGAATARRRGSFVLGKSTTNRRRKSRLVEGCFVVAQLETTFYNGKISLSEMEEAMREEVGVSLAREKQPWL